MRRAAVKANVMDDGDDRFERRLIEETSRVRVELAGVEVRLTDRVAQAEGALRQEMGALEVRLLKWSFAFWIGQVIALTAIMNLLLR